MSNAEHIRWEELELFALGAMPEDEAAAVRAHVSGCEECAAQLAQARGSAALLAFTAKQEQPAGTVKAELMARVRANREAEQRNAWPAKLAGASRSEVRRQVPETSGVWWKWVLVPVAVALAVVSFALSWQNRRITAELDREHKAAEALIHDRERIEKLVGSAGGAGYSDGEIGGSGRRSESRRACEVQREGRDRVVYSRTAGIAGEQELSNVAGAREWRPDQRGFDWTGRECLGQHVDGGSCREYAGKGICRDGGTGGRDAAADRAEGVVGSHVRLARLRFSPR